MPPYDREELKGDLMEAFDWVMKWVLFHLEYKTEPDIDDIMSLTEDTLRDYDMMHSDSLTDDQWDDIFVAVTETLIDRCGLVYDG